MRMCRPEGHVGLMLAAPETDEAAVLLGDWGSYLPGGPGIM